ncbi:MAG TPA: amidohydrolase family protein [Gemmatimonadaceae bacterium]|nr:amidohydrolase family protein [Gemmatimonadaceae bacterium]
MTRYHARWVVPVSAPPVAHGTVVERRGRIVWVGARSDAPPAHPDEDDTDLGDAILLPGLVNTHCHLELTAMRGFLDGLGFREWILRLTGARRAVFDADALLDAARLGVEEGVRAGVTTFADTGDSGAGFDAMLERGVRGICYREVFGPDPAQCDRAIGELREKLGAMRARETALVRAGVSPHAPYTVSDPLYRAAAALARELSAPVAVHIAESALETALVVEGAGSFADGLRRRGITVAARARSPIALLEALGVLAVDPLLIHCVRVDDDDIRTIAEHRCAVAHCPASNARLAHGVAPLPKLLAAGVDVGLGSDSVASNDRMDLLDEARLALLFAAAHSGDVGTLSAARALEMATLGGARALRLDREIGSLEPGKAADLAAIPLDALGRAPTHDPVAAAVLALAGTTASFVAVAGRPLVRDGVVLDADSSLARRVQRSADRLQSWLASPDGARATAHPAPTPGR